MTDSLSDLQDRFDDLSVSFELRALREQVRLKDLTFATLCDLLNLPPDDRSDTALVRAVAALKRDNDQLRFELNTYKADQADFEKSKEKLKDYIDREGIACDWPNDAIKATEAVIEHCETGWKEWEKVSAIADGLKRDNAQIHLLADSGNAARVDYESLKELLRKLTFGRVIGDLNFQSGRYNDDEDIQIIVQLEEIAYGGARRDGNDGK